LKNLYANNQDILAGDTYYVISSSNFALLKKEFRSEWLLYIQGKSNFVPEIDNSTLLCHKHDLLMFDLNKDQETEMFCTIPKEEWRELKLLYKGGPTISGTFVIGDTTAFTSIATCIECREKRYH